MKCTLAMKNEGGLRESRGACNNKHTLGSRRGHDGVWKRGFMPLPDAQGRRELLRLCLKDVETSLTTQPQTSELERIVNESEGFSCADVKLLCREAAMMPMRRLLGGATPAEIVELRAEGRLAKPPPVEAQDFLDALMRTRSSVHDKVMLEKYATWQAQFGSS